MITYKERILYNTLKKQEQQEQQEKQEKRYF